MSEAISTVRDLYDQAGIDMTKFYHATREQITTNHYNLQWTGSHYEASKQGNPSTVAP